LPRTFVVKFIFAILLLITVASAQDIQAIHSMTIRTANLIEGSGKEAYIETTIYWTEDQSQHKSLFEIAKKFAKQNQEAGVFMNNLHLDSKTKEAFKVDDSEFRNYLDSQIQNNGLAHLNQMNTEVPFEMFKKYVPGRDPSNSGVDEFFKRKSKFLKDSFFRWLDNANHKKQTLALALTRGVLSGAANFAVLHFAGNIAPAGAAMIALGSYFPIAFAAIYYNDPYLMDYIGKNKYWVQLKGWLNKKKIHLFDKVLPSVKKKSTSVMAYLKWAKIEYAVYQMINTVSMIASSSGLLGNHPNMESPIYSQLDIVEGTAFAVASQGTWDASFIEWRENKLLQFGLAKQETDPKTGKVKIIEIPESKLTKNQLRARKVIKLKSDTANLAGAMVWVVSSSLQALGIKLGLESMPGLKIHHLAYTTLAVAGGAHFAMIHKAKVKGHYKPIDPKKLENCNSMFDVFMLVKVDTLKLLHDSNKRYLAPWRIGTTNVFYAA
jgi:hypothetical protein